MTRAVAAVKGGFWEQYATTLTNMNSLGAARRTVARVLGTRSLFKDRELMATLNGVAAGSAALKQYSRVTASSELGGVRAIETVDVVNRVTVAGDVTEDNRMLDFTGLTSDPTPVANGDGNPLGFR